MRETRGPGLEAANFRAESAEGGMERQNLKYKKDFRAFEKVLDQDLKKTQAGNRQVLRQQLHELDRPLFRLKVDESIEAADQKGDLIATADFAASEMWGKNTREERSKQYQAAQVYRTNTIQILQHRIEETEYGSTQRNLQKDIQALKKISALERENSEQALEMTRRFRERELAIIENVDDEQPNLAEHLDSDLVAILKSSRLIKESLARFKKAEGDIPDKEKKQQSLLEMHTQIVALAGYAEKRAEDSQEPRDLEILVLLKETGYKPDPAVLDKIERTMADAVSVKNGEQKKPYIDKNWQARFRELIAELRK